MSKCVRFYIIGKDSIAEQCAKHILADSDFKLLGIVSNTQSLKHWAAQNNIPTFKTVDEWLESNIEDFDYLLSAYNDEILSREVLSLPKVCAINYHHSLLPTYCGSNSTSWAILNNEREHGVTWHVMTDVIDAGDILKQKRFLVSDDETALSLNMKCMVKALGLFEELLTDIKHNKLKMLPQDLSKRTYYTINQKPKNLGVIDWSNDAATIYRQFRAAHLGNHDNRFVSCKLFAAGQFYIVKQLQIKTKNQESNPGTILERHGSYLRIATKTDDIIISELLTLDNELIDIVDWSKQTHCDVGYVLKSLPKATLKKLQQAFEQSSKYEFYWVQQWQSVQQTSLAYFSYPNEIVDKTAKYKFDINLGANKKDADVMLAVLLSVYSYRLHPQGNISLGIIPEKTADLGLISCCNPFTISFDNDDSFAKVYKKVANSLVKHKGRGSFIKDISCRYPSLASCSTNKANVFPFIIKEKDYDETQSIKTPSLIVSYDSEKQSCDLCLHYSILETFNSKLLLQTIAQHLSSILQCTTTQSETSVKKYQYLTVEETLAYQSKTKICNKTDISKSIVEHFTAQAKKFPDKIAVFHNSDQVTYSELDQRSEDLAILLQTNGVKPGASVAFILDRSINAIVSMLAILKTRAAYTPISPSIPVNRFESILNDLCPHIVLTETQNIAHFKGQLDRHNINMLDVTVVPKTKAKQKFKSLDVSAEDRAYILYTSGSTGNPKGVIVQHKGVVNLALKQNYGAFTSNDIVAHSTSLTFDVSGFEIWGALLNGATLEVIDQDLLMNPVEYAGRIKHRCSIVFITPTIAIEVNNSVSDAFDHLRLLFIGGEALYSQDIQKLIRRIKAKNLPLEVVNIYGPTENSIWSLSYPIKSLSKIGENVPIGKPLNNVQAYVLDSELNPVPHCVLGDLYLGGVGLATGYHNLEEQTKSAFIKHSFNQKDEVTLYRTGDVVRQNQEGEFVFIGRKDNQIKFYGHRIELNGINAILMRHENVKQSLVLVNDKGRNQKFLVAYVVPNNDVYSLADYTRHMKNFLPSYMQPTSYFILKSFPLSDSNKIDIKKLPTDKTISGSRTKALPNKIESLLIKSWKEFLKADQLTIDDNYFSLGGNSIVAMQIAAHAYHAGLEISPSDIFQYPTIKQLAKKIDFRRKKQKKQHDSSKNDVLLTPAQQRYFQSVFKTEFFDSHYAILQITSKDDLKLLEKALVLLVNRHESLRVSFDVSVKPPKQHISHPINSIEVDDIVLDDDLLENDISAIQTYVSNNIDSFDLSQSPLLKAISFQTGSRQYLLLIMHSLIADYASWNVCIQDLQVIFSALKLNNEPAQISTPISYQKIIENMTKKANSSELKKECLYWQQQSCQFRLPLDFPRNDNWFADTEYTSRNYAYSVDTLSKSKVTIKDVFITALVITISKWTQANTLSLDFQSRDSIIQANCHAKPELVACLNTSFPVKFVVDDLNAPNFLSKTLSNIRVTLAHIPEHGQGYGLLRYASNNNAIKDKTSTIVESPVSFVYLGEINQPSCDANNIASSNIVYPSDRAPIQFLKSGSQERGHLLEVISWIDNGKMHATIQYNRKHFKKSTMKRICDTFFDFIKMLFVIDHEQLLKSYIPSDFPLASINQAQLNYYLAKFTKIEDIAELSPLQEGLLFLRLYNVHNQMYHTQVVWHDIRGLNEKIFRRACHELIKRHSIFRTNFVWKHLDRPLQIITEDYNFSIKYYDLSSLPRVETNANLRTIKFEDVDQRFHFQNPPLMRMSIVKITPHEHVIVWTIHHILLGGWSLDTALEEIYNIYDALLHNRAPELPPSLPYTSYIDFLKTSVDQSRNKRFWKKYLADFTLTHIASNSIGPQDYPYEFEYSTHTVEPVLSHKIKMCAKQNQSYSLNTLMLFAWSLLLSRYTGSFDVLFGIVVSTRHAQYSGDETILGPLLNTLPFRHIIQEDDTVRRSLNTIQRNVAKITQHCHTPLSTIQHWLNFSSELALFNTLVIFENFPFTFKNENIHDFSIKEIHHFPLTLTILPQDNLKFVMRYNKRLISESVCENILASFCLILEEMTDDISILSKSIDILPKHQKQHILNPSALNLKSYPKQTIAQLFDECARKKPEKIALTSGENQFTYDYLNKITNQWANYLIKLGVKVGDSIAIYCDRSESLVFAVLAILKSGAAYVPIDQHLPSKQIDYILTTANSKFVIIDSTTAKHVNIDSTTPMLNISDATLVEDSSSAMPQINSDPNNLAYIAFTSGTSGVPKGIRVRQSSVVNVIYSVFKTINATNHDVFVSVTSISFDISALEILGSLIWGMQLVLANKRVISEPEAFKQLAERTSATISQATPSFWHRIVSSGWRPSRQFKVLCGGEPLSQKLADELLHIGVSLWNVYGPTETTIWSTIYGLAPGEKVTIGKPLFNTSVYILDSDLHPTPAGVAGELYIGGDGVSDGYINQDELNNKNFIHNPYSEQHPILYKTGDRVRRLISGNMVFIDRVDNQVKVNGFRIELNAISNTVNQLATIKDSIVIKRQNQEDNNSVELIIFYIPYLMGEVSSEELRSYISASLPSYMVPNDFVELSSFPVTTSGKVDSRKLLKLYDTRNDQQVVKKVDVLTPNEQLIITLFSNIFGKKNISLDDNFFELGGDSITILRLISNIEDNFSIQLTIQEVFQMQTPRKIMEAILLKNTGTRDYGLIPYPIVCLKKGNKRPPLFLIHPISGTVFWYIKLSQLMGDDRSIYAIHDPALESNKVHFSNLDSMGEFYLQAIKKIQPSGPYNIAGASFGANMSVIIANKLLAQGDKVGLVGLLDGWTKIPDIVLNKSYLTSTMKRQFKSISMQLPNVTGYDLKSIINISWHRLHMLEAYNLAWTDCSLTLFKATETLESYQSILAPDNHWQSHCPELSIILVPGDHETMFYSPNVEKLASKLSDALAKLEQNDIYVEGTVS